MKIKSLFLISMMIVLSGCGAKPSSKSSSSFKSTSTQSRPVVPHTFDENNIVANFGVVSDVHHSDNIVKGLNVFKNVGGIDGLVISGDITDGIRYYTGTEWEFDTVKTNVLNNINNDTAIVMCLGNHDSSNGSHAAKFYDNLGTRFYSNVDDKTYTRTSGNSHSVVKGYHFICLECDYDKEELATGAKAYLESKLSAITSDPSYKGEYIFIVTHLIPKDYLNHSSSMTSLSDVLKNYPQAIVIAGHNHNTLYDEYNIMQKDFTVVNPGAITFSDFYRIDQYIENKETGNEIIKKGNYTAYDLPTGIHLSIDANGNIRMRRYDFAHENYEINDPWYLKAPKADKSHLCSYTSARKENRDAPTWVRAAADKSTAVYDSNAKTVTITFPRPKPTSGYIYEYGVEVVYSSSSKTTFYSLSDFYLYPNTLDMPEMYTIKITDIKSKPTKVGITAIDDLRVESEKKLALTVS